MIFELKLFCRFLDRNVTFFTSFLTNDWKLNIQEKCWRKENLSLTLVSSNRILSNYQYFNHETNTLRTTPSFDIPNLDQL